MQEYQIQMQTWDEEREAFIPTMPISRALDVKVGEITASVDTIEDPTNGYTRYRMVGEPVKNALGEQIVSNETLRQSLSYIKRYLFQLDKVAIEHRAVTSNRGESSAIDLATIKAVNDVDTDLSALTTSFNNFKTWSEQNFSRKPHRFTSPSGSASGLQTNANNANTENYNHGISNANYWGHVKLSDVHNAELNINGVNGAGAANSNEGIAASQHGLYVAWKDLDDRKAPNDHRVAVNDNNTNVYGNADYNTYGHVAYNSTHSFDVNDIGAAGTVFTVRGTAKNSTIKRAASAYQVDQLYAYILTLAGNKDNIGWKAPKDHQADLATTYGAGTGSKYGHVKLDDTYKTAADSTTQAAAYSLGASSYAVHAMWAESVTTFAPMSHASSSLTHGGGTPTNYGHVRVFDEEDNSKTASGSNAISPYWAYQHKADRGSSSVFSHVALSDVKYGESSKGASSHYAATPKALYDTWSDLNNEKADNDHKSEDTTYGVGDAAYYGHLKLSDAVDSSSSVGDGIASTPKSTKIAYEKAVEALNKANEAANEAANTFGNHASVQAGNITLGHVRVRETPSSTDENYDVASSKYVAQLATNVYDLRGAASAGNVGSSLNPTYLLNGLTVASLLKLKTNTRSTLGGAASNTSGREYLVHIDKDGYLSVNVPWVDTNTDTDTHHTSYTYVGDETTTNAHTQVTSNPYLKHVENGSIRSKVRFVAGAAVTISSDTSGNITISSSDTHYNSYSAIGTYDTLNTANASSDPYLKHIENNVIRSRVRFMGGGGTTVSSDANGNVTISSASIGGAGSSVDLSQYTLLSTHNAHAASGGTSSALGHLKISDEYQSMSTYGTDDVAYNNRTGGAKDYLAASQWALNSVYSALCDDISNHSDIPGNGAGYGHVRLSDAVDSTSNVNGGVAATPYAVKRVYDTLVNHTTSTATSSGAAHVYLSDSTTSSSGAASGYAATPLAVKSAKDACAPKSHASSTIDYGIGTNIDFGHLKLSDDIDLYSTTGNGVAATPYAVKSALANAKSSCAPTSHASTATTYGVATSSRYGHVKLTADWTWDKTEEELQNTEKNVALSEITAQHILGQIRDMGLKIISKQKLTGLGIISTINDKIKYIYECLVPALAASVALSSGARYFNDGTHQKSRILSTAGSWSGADAALANHVLVMHNTNQSQYAGFYRSDYCGCVYVFGDKKTGSTKDSRSTTRAMFVQVDGYNDGQIPICTAYGDLNTDGMVPETLTKMPDIHPYISGTSNARMVNVYRFITVVDLSSTDVLIANLLYFVYDNTDNGVIDNGDLAGSLFTQAVGSEYKCGLMALGNDYNDPENNTDTQFLASEINKDFHAWLPLTTSVFPDWT